MFLSSIFHRNCHSHKHEKKGTLCKRQMYPNANDNAITGVSHLPAFDNNSTVGEFTSSFYWIPYQILSMFAYVKKKINCWLCCLFFLLCFWCSKHSIHSTRTIQLFPLLLSYSLLIFLIQILIPPKASHHSTLKSHCLACTLFICCFSKQITPITRASKIA